MTEDLIEKWAIRLALGNNGGEWAKHYTEKQKDFWRNFVREMGREMYERFNKEQDQWEWYWSNK